MRWWAVCFIRELPLLTVEPPGVWHICGTSHRTRANSSGPLVSEGSSLSRARPGGGAIRVYPLP